MNVENIVPMSLPPPSRPSRRDLHQSVLRDELVSALAPREGGVYADVTIGAAGHAEAILEVPGTRVIGLDRDAGALAFASARLERFGARVRLLHGKMGDLAKHLASVGVTTVDGLAADVGVSSMQLDDPARGISFRVAGPLDMRMDRSTGETAIELIDRLDDDALADVIYRYGEERRSRRVARCIKQARAAGDLETTLDLRRAVVRAVGPARHGGVDPATRTFQALRIAVNGELDEIERLLAAAPAIVASGGVLAVITFHSLEDRLVKRALRDTALWRPMTKKPIVPSEDEIADNPRSRSAKLRAAHRLGPDEEPASTDEWSGAEEGGMQA
jgi:16S rRNA (cytosine1402-N4)-methyltransferase